MADGQRFGVVAPGIADLHALQMRLSFQSHDLRQRAHGDVAALLDAADEVARHRLGKPGPAYENLDTARRRSEKDGRLPGRIGAADDDHVFRFAELRLHVGRTVIDAQPLEPGKVGQRQLPVLHAGGDDQRARLDRSTR